MSLKLIQECNVIKSVKQKIGKFLNCIVCNKEFYRHPHQILIGKSKFCSYVCMGVHRKTNPSKKRKGSEVQCLICKKSFYLSPYKLGAVKNFCSPTCYFKHDRDRKIDLKCLKCNKNYKTYKSQVKHRGESKFCSTTCRWLYKKENFVPFKETQNIASLKKQLWIYFSKYIRQRDEGKCITCNKVDDWRNTDAGHFIPRNKLAVCFDEQNVHCQCVNCNRFLKGNLEIYRSKLTERYGEKIVSLLEKKTHDQSFRISTLEYQSMIQRYKNKLKDNGFFYTSKKC